MALSVKMMSAFAVLEYQKLQITTSKVSVFRFRVSVFVFLLPDT